MRAPGDSFAHYQIEALLGQGGMGEVYRAFDTKLHRRVALKLLLAPEITSEASRNEATARMIREARAAAALDHPNKVSVFEFGDVDGTPYLAMELITGPTLRAMVGDRSIVWQDVLAWLLDVARALDAAHAAGLVHRDIKPDNVMLRQDGVIKVLDFGIARRTTAPADASAATAGAGVPLATGGVIAGTAAYMAPEQVRGDDLDGRCDQFAWGVMAFELLTGEHPWGSGRDALVLISTMLTKKPRGLVDLRPELPRSLSEAIARTLSGDREGRYPTMRALVSDVGPLIGQSERGKPAIGSHGSSEDVTSARTEQAPSAPSGNALADKPSIAVMPFTNMSGDPEQEYFVDGIVEDMITGLSRIKWLFVMARNSTFAYKGRAVDLKEVGRELGVRYLLEGSLRKAGNRVRITAQLIETATGTHVWAERYDRALDDIFELQDEITLSIVGAIEPNLRQAEIERAKRKRPESLDAYDLYLRALPHVQVYMPGDGDAALTPLHQALALQPDYPAAHAAVAWCHEVRYMRAGMEEADKTAALAHAHAAIESGADDAMTLATAGFVIGLVVHDYETAMTAIDGAVALSPFSTTALSLGSIILAHAGDTARAVDYAKRAIHLLPFGRELGNPYLGLAMAYCAEGKFAAAIAASSKAIQANPRFSVPHVMHVAALSALGRVGEAKAAALRVLELEPRFNVAGFVKAHTGRAEMWTPIGNALREAGLPG